MHRAVACAALTASLPPSMLFALALALSYKGTSLPPTQRTVAQRPTSFQALFPRPTKASIRAKFHQSAKRCHPDIAGNTSSAAWEKLASDYSCELEKARNEDNLLSSAAILLGSTFVVTHLTPLLGVVSAVAGLSALLGRKAPEGARRAQLRSSTSKWKLILVLPAHVCRALIKHGRRSLDAFLRAARAAKRGGTATGAGRASSDVGAAGARVARRGLVLPSRIPTNTQKA